MISTSKKLLLLAMGSFGKNIPIIAGPNGVESIKLMHQVAECLKKNGLNITGVMHINR